MNTTTQTQLVIIGAGPGGYTAAFLAADQGLKVTLIDYNPLLGGTCLHQGCIPSKALLSVVQTINRAQEIKGCGIHFQKPEIRLEELLTFKKNIVSKLSTGLSHLCKQKKIRFVQGSASFASSRTLDIRKLDDTIETIEFEKCIIATGSQAIKPPVIPQELPGIMFSSEALELKEIPESLLVIGGGYIGLEMASIYAGLGTKVTTCEMMSTLLSGTDQDLVAVVLKSLKKKGLSTKLSTTVKKIMPAVNGLEVTFDHANKEEKESFSKILVATGRRPNTESLRLENTKIQQEKNGFIKINANHQTEDKDIYALGDVVCGPMLAHKASYEATIAISNLTGKKDEHAHAIIPCVVFTDPEIAYCGLTEDLAKEQNLKIEISKFPWAANGRATSLNRSDGLTKIIVDAKSKKLLGAGIVGMEAGELIAQALLSMNADTKTATLAASIYPHPTLSETFKECLELSLGKSFYSVKK
ncbi:MAG: dihydrolipoyl dehydrogenase [Candidatus Omnitrophota bacterium]|jgi:dihydrolipoamide dehydrogenase